MIEDPGSGDFRRRGSCRGAGQDDRGLRRERGEKCLVYVEADFGGFPLDCVDVESVGEIFAAGETCGRSEVGGGTVGERAVDGAVNCGRLFTDVLHDVDLAALGPADRVDIIAEHPEGGPDALAFGDFDARLETSESLGEEALRFQARGCVFAGDVVGAFVLFFARGDDEIAVFDVGVLATICVGLEFVVAPAATAEIVSPFFWVGKGAVGGVEFVGPDQGEIFEIDGIGGFGLS
jgi:hypothetical protein